MGQVWGPRHAAAKRREPFSDRVNSRYHMRTTRAEQQHMIPPTPIDPANAPPVSDAFPSPGAPPPDGAPTARIEEENRPLMPALRRGWRRRCPSCGGGPIFNGYLSVRDRCAVCGTELHHQRADDGPAYLTILIVGHLMAPTLHFSWVWFEPEPLVLATFLSLACAALSLYLLPRIKGGMIALQWAKRMHGFGAATPARPQGD